jgi:OmcA/MtrC family decaheme c-type cytochrome
MVALPVRQKDVAGPRAADNPVGFKIVTYPGILKSCETCHVAGSYDFSAGANSAALPNLLWTTDAKTDMSNPNNAPSLGLSPWVTTLGRGQVDYTNDNLVSSPIAASCFGCHDSSLAVQHMVSNGGTLVTSFSKVSSVATRPAIGAASTMKFTKAEQCMLCHASGKVADIKVMHAK